jgi:hypothetical protein
MSNEKTTESGADTTLMTLDQLTQTIEMMTSVVNRLKRHLQLQLSLHEGEDIPEALRRELLANERELQSMQQLASGTAPGALAAHDTSHQSIVLEITLLDESSDALQERVLH